MNHIEEAPLIDDLLEDLFEASPIGARGRRGKPNEGTQKVIIKDPELRKDSLIVFSDRVVTFIIDNQLKATLYVSDETSESIDVERSERGDDDFRS